MSPSPARVRRPAVAAVVVATLVVLVVVLAGCGSDPVLAAPAPAAPPAARPVATAVTVPGSPTFDRMRQRGRVVIGVKNDEPGLGLQDPTSGQYSGFDIEIALIVAAGLGFDGDHIDFVPVPSAAREDAIVRGDVDWLVGSYSISDVRKQRVGFAGPYFVTGQDLLVRATDPTITGPDVLHGRRVCAVSGSTPLERLRALALTEPENVLEFQTYTRCVQELLGGGVDAVTSDRAILAGFATQDPQRLRVVGNEFSVEPYGVGLAVGDAALRSRIDDLLAAADADGTWRLVHDRTLGRLGDRSVAPPLQRY